MLAYFQINGFFFLDIYSAVELLDDMVVPFLVLGGMTLATLKDKLWGK